ncbi:MAG: PsiF family protein [Betaproteobacteria bacterium]
MNKLNAMLLAAVFGFGASLAHADDTPTNAALKSKATRPPVAQPAAAPAVPVKVSQQEKMRLCSKQATGKKGAERKDFMRTCLSKKA